MQGRSVNFTWITHQKKVNGAPKARNALVGPGVMPQAGEAHIRGSNMPFSKQQFHTLKNVDYLITYVLYMLDN